MDDKKFKWGLIVPNIVSLVLVGFNKFMFANYLDSTVSGVVTYSNFFLVPAVMGFVSAWYWKDSSMKTSRYIGWSAVNSLIAICASAIFLKEGVVCLLIVSPVIFGLMVAGALLGRVMFRKKSPTMNVSLFGILVVLFVVDLFSPHEYTNQVSDTIIVNAPIEKVWPLVVEYEPITLEDKYWLFKIGMPSPVQSTVDGYQVGAGRKCVFSNGYVFDEKMVVYKPNEELTFDIISQPRDPEIMGHIDILRGQFILRDNGDGTTTLIGNSWYKLYVFPAWYFDLWAVSITRNVHLRVMEHIKILAEKGV